MTSARFVQMAGLLAVTAILSSVVTAGAQTAQAPSALKTIGAPAAAAKPEIVPSLFVLNSRGATLQGETLVLTGVAPNSIIFADRPVRSAGHQPTADVIAEWGSGDDSFAKNPPNATLSVFGKDGAVKDAVVVLKNPKLEGDKLTFTVQTLEGDIAGADGGAAFSLTSSAGRSRRCRLPASHGVRHSGARCMPVRPPPPPMVRLPIRSPYAYAYPPRPAAITPIRPVTEANEKAGKCVLPRFRSLVAFDPRSNI